LCSWDVTSLWGDPNLLNNGALLKFNESAVQPSVNPNSWITVEFAGSRAYQGYVQITTVPEPSAAALLLAGASLAAIGFGGWHRPGRRGRLVAGSVE
jgi:hypothetical protein